MKDIRDYMRSPKNGPTSTLSVLLNVLAAQVMKGSRQDIMVMPEPYPIHKIMFSGNSKVCKGQEDGPLRRPFFLHCKRSALSFAEHGPGYNLRIELFPD